MHEKGSKMGEILRSWIQARLGVMIDLSPDMFGHYTRDGNLLAQILHSYDIINRVQLDTIAQTTDPALCRVNLKHLKFWLRFLGIDCDDESIAEISCGKGATSLRIFYKLYLCLEGKDRLHFITLQKEREKFVPTSKKFEVTTVSEDPPPYQPPDHPLCAKLVRGEVDQTCFKFPAAFRRLRRQRKELEEPWKQYPITHVVEHTPCEMDKTPRDNVRKESEELDHFARKHRVRQKKFEQFEDEQRYLEAERAKFEEELQKASEVAEASTEYVEKLKDRAKCATISTALKRRMHKALIGDLIERTSREQERSFDEVIAERTLDQSRYEKQMVTKMLEAREQKNLMIENQRIVEDMTLKASELEHQADFELEKDLLCKKQNDMVAECQRMCELRCRLMEEKISRIHAKHYKHCRQTMYDLLSIALNIGEYRRVNGGHVPVSLLSEWYAMFFKLQPIHDERFSAQSIDDHHYHHQPDLDDMFHDWGRCVVPDMTDSQCEVLLDEYLETNAPWNQFEPILNEDETETFELGRKVLGYVVHRLLNALYPRPPNRGQSVLARYRSAAILLGLASTDAHRSIKLLLESNGIRLVRLEDAINYCLQRYKDEMSDVEYIDATVVGATRDTVCKLRGKRSLIPNPPRSERSNKVSESFDASEGDTEEEKGTKRSARSSRSTRRHSMEKELKTVEKQTQTPRNIPFDDMDPVLTDTAYIGKWVHEFLTLGEPISNELATKIIIEYLKSATDAKSWALVDYPSTYEQMSQLETVLNGVPPPPDPKELDFKDVTIEEIESPPPRIVFEDVDDPFALNRYSRLVPDPIENRKVEDGRSTFVTMFIRIAPIPKDFQADRTYVPLGDDAPSVDRFYASQKIAYVLYYSSLDSAVLKRLARLVIGDPLQTKPSDELFGDALKEIGDSDTGQKLAGSRPPMIRRLLLEVDVPDTESNDTRMSVAVHESLRAIYQAEWMFESEQVRPGMPNWQWIEFPLPSGLLESLGSLWERLEKAYLDNLKEMLYLKSIHLSGVVPYRDLVTRNMNEFIRRPDNKQDLLDKFHKAFNAIDPDARHDLDVKCELHRRVADFQAALWDICDQRKNEAEEERRRLINDHWAVLETSILYNVYVGIVQAELDRFIDTMRLIEDYYLAMLKKPLPVSSAPKVVLNRIEVETSEPLRFEERPFSESARKEVEAVDRKKLRSGRKGKSTDALPAAVDLAVLRRQINDALFDKKKILREVENCSAYQGIVENVRYARNMVDAMAATASEVVRKEQLGALKLGKYMPNDSIDSIIVRTVNKGEDLTLEWRYAIEYEINRVRMKLASIIAVARSDFSFLLDTMQQTFHGIYDSIVDRYWRETRSVNEAANVFCFAIEEGRIIENEMLLEGDTFVVRSNVFVTAIDLNKHNILLRESVSDSRFRIIDLGRLMEIFKRVAPYGNISERAFVYIMQDLVSHTREEGESLLLPYYCYQLRSSDVAVLVHRLFGTVQHIDWREFIVYALELPWPTYRELLVVRDRFRAQDPDTKETVTRAQFHRTPFWFLDDTRIDHEIYDLLRDDFQRTVEQLYQDDVYRPKNDDSDTATLKVRKSAMFATDTHGSLDAEETIRRTLAKELLCRMYSVDRHTVNYTALLLAFCKQENPRDGYGMALALALGKRVCSDMVEGETYVQEIYERKRLGLSWRRISRNEALEVIREILDQLLDRVTVLDFEEEYEETNTVSNLSSIYSWNIEIEGESSLTDSAIEAGARDLVVYWLPLDLCLTVLAAALPWHVLQPEIIGQCQNLRDRLSLVFRELRDEYLAEQQKNVVLAHRLLHHDFITRLLNSVSNFTAKNIGEEVRKILQEKEQP